MLSTKTISCPILGIHRSFCSALSIIKHNFNQDVPQSNNGREQLCHSIILHKDYRSSTMPIFSKIILPTCRSIHTSSTAFQNGIERSLQLQSETSEPISSFRQKGKLFVEVESEFYHSVLANLTSYSGTIYKDDPQFTETYRLSDIEFKKIVETENWDCKSPYDIITSFISVGVYTRNKPNLTIEDQQFEALISALVKALPLSTDEQLIDCFIALKYWPLLTNIQDPQVLKIWRELDQVCLKRFLDWSIDKSLFMIDLWYQLRLLRKSHFVYKGLVRASRKSDEFTAAQLIQCLFYTSCIRTIGQIPIREYEHYIQRYITNLSIEEIGIFALAFFKTKTLILSTKILMYMMQRTVEEADTINTLVLASIAKVVRLSHKPEIGFTANDFIAKILERRRDTLSLLTNIHMVHIGTQVQFYNEETLTKLCEQFCNNPSEARLKDMERIAFFISLYNFIPHSTPDICQLIVKELNTPLRAMEAEKYYLFFLSLVYFLSLLQVFPEKQIQQAINEEFLINKYDNKYIIPQQTVQLDYNRVLEGPPGSEHLLSPVLREYLARRYSVFFPQEGRRVKNNFDRLMSEIMKTTDDLLGKENYLVMYTLPHFPKADILFHLDDNGNPLPIPEEMRTASLFDDVHRPTGPGKWYSVVIGGRNMYMHNVPRLVGEQATKLRQLKLVGYTPIVIPSYYWMKEQDKMAYLKLKYFSDHEQNKK